MRAYAILDGGGVKGAALVGALQAANNNQIEWVGYGGTSAGAIVCVLAHVGYTPTELKREIVNRPFTELLDDGDGSQLIAHKEAIADILDGVTNGWMLIRPLRTVYRLLRHRKLLNAFQDNLGVYKGDKLRSWLLDKILAKHPNIGNGNDITFADLQSVNDKPLKMLASDISYRRPYIFPDYSGPHASVLSAVRASICYPFVFQSERHGGTSRLVDGGLCSNLPACLFGTESRKNRIPIIAIDLVRKKGIVPTPAPGLQAYFCDMLDTALEGSEELLRDQLEYLHHVCVEIDPPVDTIDFQLNQHSRTVLYQNGFEAFSEYYTERLRPMERAQDKIQQLQALYADPKLVEPILELVAKGIEDLTNAERVRAHVMLPTGDGRRVVTYQYGMDGMPDRTLDLGESAGCSGEAYSRGEAVYADLEEAKIHFEEWGLTREEQDRIASDRKAMISVPIFDTRDIRPSEERVNRLDLPKVGTLSVDTATTGQDAKWVTIDGEKIEFNGQILDFMEKWADIVGKLLT